MSSLRIEESQEIRIRETVRVTVKSVERKDDGDKQELQ